MKIAHVHFYTRDAASTKDWFVRNVGLNAIGSSNNQHTYTEIISLNSSYIVVSSPLTTDSPVAQYLDLHPSGVADIAFEVKDIQTIIDRAKYLELKILQPLQTVCSCQGRFRYAKIQGWNDLQHTLIERIEDRGDLYLPNLEIEFNSSVENFNSYITNIDHIVLNVAAGQLNCAVELYQKLFGFKIQQSFDIHTATSGLYSQALIDDRAQVQFNINEPTSTNSQIQEFIDLNKGSGIQHLALRSQNLIADVERMLRHKVKFLAIPKTYYTHQLYKLINLSETEWQAIVKKQILVDRDRANSQALLMQIFTQPIFEQPTFFLEFIERRQQAKGFGQGNFKALFAAVEREQARVKDR